MTPFYQHLLHALKEWPRYVVHHDGLAVKHGFEEAFRLKTDPPNMIRWRQWGERVAEASKVAERLTHAGWILARKKAAERQEKRRKAREEKEKLFAMLPQFMLPANKREALEAFLSKQMATAIDEAIITIINNKPEVAMSPFRRQLLSLEDWPRYAVHQDGQTVNGSHPYARAFRLKADAEDMIRWEQYANSALYCEMVESMTYSEWELATDGIRAREAEQRQMRKKQRKEAVKRMLAKAASLTLADARVYTQQADPKDLYPSIDLRDDKQREAVMKELRTASTNEGTSMKTPVWKATPKEQQPAPMNLIPFDVEKAKAGAQIVTRAGLSARVLCYDFKGDELSVVAAIMEDDNGEILIRHSVEGMVYTSGEQSNYDLFLVPKTKKVWLWVYIDKQRRSAVTFDTKESMLEWQTMCAQYAIPLLEQEIEIPDL